jgi:hypothetical protein
VESGHTQREGGEPGDVKPLNRRGWSRENLKGVFAWGYADKKDPHFRQSVMMPNIVLTRSVSEGKTLALADASS